MAGWFPVGSPMLSTLVLSPLIFIQERCEDTGRHKKYKDLCKKVRRAVREDKEKWLDGVMKGLEDDMKCHRQGSFFKKMRQLTATRVTPMSNIMNESGQPLQKSEEKLAR